MPTVTIVGAGVIGASFARLFAKAGWKVRLNDPRPDLDQIIKTQLAGLPVVGFSDLAEAAQGAPRRVAGPGSGTGSRGAGAVLLQPTDST